MCTAITALGIFGICMIGLEDFKGRRHASQSSVAIGGPKKERCQKKGAPSSLTVGGKKGRKEGEEWRE